MKDRAGSESGRVINAALLMPELEFVMSRSCGPGGQHVNKVSSKVTLRWNVQSSGILLPQEKELLFQRLASRITLGGDLVLSMQESRSQTRNRQAVMDRLDYLLQKATAKRKIRKPSKPTAVSSKKRVDWKRRHGEKKAWRKRPD